LLISVINKKKNCSRAAHASLIPTSQRY